MFVASSFGRICTAIALAMSINTAALALVTVPAGGMIDAPAGSVNLACDGLTVLSGGTYQVGASSVLNTGNVNLQGTLNGGSGTVQVTGNWSNSGTFNAGSGTVIFAGSCGSGVQTISGPNTTIFNNLTLTSQSGQTCGAQGQYLTVNGVLTLAGGPIPPCIVLGPSATVVGASYAPQAIPTLSEWAMILLSLLLAGSTYWRGRIGGNNTTRKNQHH